MSRLPHPAALEVRAVSRLLKALADETRLRLVVLLANGELCVCHLAEALKLSQPNISRHLGILRMSDVVETRRDGSWVYYRLAAQADSDCRRLLKGLVQSFGKRAVLRRDLARLVKSCGPEACR